MNRLSSGSTITGLLDRLRYQNIHSQQRASGSFIFGEAIEAIEMLATENERLREALAAHAPHELNRIERESAGGKDRE